MLNLVCLKSSPSPFAYCDSDLLVSDEAMKIIYLYHNGMLYHESFEGDRFDCARMDLVKNLSPRIARVSLVFLMRVI